MRLYHFTSANHLAPIGRCGLTIGDVPTDMDRADGVVGVWLTTAGEPVGLGLEGASVDKRRIRLSVDVEENSLLLHRWPAWAAKHAQPRTVVALHNAAGAGADPATWYVYFGWIRPERITEAIDMATGSIIAEWKDGLPDHPALEAVTYADRRKWHREFLRRFGKGGGKRKATSRR